MLTSEWIAEPETIEDAQAELLLVEGEIEDLKSRRRAIQGLLLDLESDRSHLRQLLEHKRKQQA